MKSEDLFSTATFFAHVIGIIETALQICFIGSFEQYPSTHEVFFVWFLSNYSTRAFLRDIIKWQASTAVILFVVCLTNQFFPKHIFAAYLFAVVILLLITAIVFFIYYRICGKSIQLIMQLV